jgi:protein TonB
MERESAPSCASAVRYPSGRRSRRVLAMAVLVSASLHAALFFGFRPATRKPVTAPKEEFTIRLLPMPEVKELEEPETIPGDEAPPPDTSVLVPMQQDLPQAPQVTDFVQQINFASFLEQPDFSQLKVYTVPENIRTAGAGMAQKLGKIFNLEDLDRPPEPLFQPAPMYPHAMRREGATAKVMVEFIVDEHGAVLAPIVFETTHHGFDDAALAGVARWKFRPGIHSGRKVNTRMRVPIAFTLAEPEI